jgi:DNA-binding transcriptional LysR family regulator
MDPRKLRAFYYVGKYGSLLTAANYLKVSSPAISVQLKALEKELQVKLFHRYPNRLILTEHGRLLLNKASRVFEAMTQFEETASQAPQTDSELLTIALGSDLPKFLAPQIAAFSRSHPRLRMTIISRPSETLSLLLEGAVDVAIGWFPKVPRALQKRTLFDSKMYLVFPRNHPLSRKQNVSLADIASFRLILHARTAAARRVVDSRFHDNGIEIDNMLEVGTCEAIATFVRLGVGIGFIHDICLPKRRDRSMGWVDMSPKLGTLEVSLVYKKSTASRSSYQALIQSLTPSREPIAQ